MMNLISLAAVVAAVAGVGEGPREEASERMMRQVDLAWGRPVVAVAGGGASDDVGAAGRLERKLASIVLPSVNFSGAGLGRVVSALGAASQEFDAGDDPPNGVNIVLVDPSGAEPTVDIAVRNIALGRALQLVADSVGYVVELQEDAAVLKPANAPYLHETRFFPVSRATVLRLTGRGGSAAPERGYGDPLAGGGGTDSARAPLSVDAEGRAIRDFLQLAGVDFAGTAGSSLAFDGSQLIVTQSPRNLERVRNILARYRNLRQVEIEAKFMEVQEGALEELGVQWNVATRATQGNAGAQADYSTGNGVVRNLSEAFSFSGNRRTLDITAPASTTLVNNADGSQTPVTNPGINLSLPTSPPVIPGGAALGAPGATLAEVTGVVGEFDVNAVVRALSQKSGTELLSAPKLTVLSGNAATITIAQELRYPQSYGQIQSQVGTGNLSGGGSAGVSITSGTPQDFATRNVGVELRVTPTVEEDNRSISLDLHPKVTEFEGFVEYGGPSVAISGGTTVTVPPGFYQPIFAVREMSTRVTIWDGATLVMGGLTREDVRKVKDKVPLLGSVPLIGRLFRSEGESSQKRNLLIFVTAHLVTPGGGLKRNQEPGPDRSAAQPSP